MDTVIYIVIVVIILLLLLLGYAIYCGLFHRITIETLASPYPSFRVAYKYVTGPYSNAGSYFSEAGKLGPDKQCFGIYYDDPNEIPAAKLRCIVGSILSEDEEEINEDLKKRYQENGYKVFEFPKADNVVRTWFPLKSRFSVFIAIIKVWPKISSYVKKASLKAYPFMELYTSTEIHFIGMLDHHDDFVTPEVTQEHAKKD